MSTAATTPKHFGGASHNRRMLTFSCSRESGAARHNSICQTSFRCVRIHNRVLNPQAMFPAVCSVRPRHKLLHCKAAIDIDCIAGFPGVDQGMSRRGSTHRTSMEMAGMSANSDQENLKCSNLDCRQKNDSVRRDGAGHWQRSHWRPVRGASVAAKRDAPPASPPLACPGPASAARCTVTVPSLQCDKLSIN